MPTLEVTILTALVTDGRRLAEGAAVSIQAFARALICCPGRARGALLLLTPFVLIVASGCGLAPAGPAPTPVVVVVTATPGPAEPTPTPVVVVVTATPAPASAPGASATSPVANATPAAARSPVAASKPGRASSPAAAAASPAVPQEQTLAVGRTNAYRGLMFTVEEARSGQEIEGEKAARNRTLVGLRLHVHNPGGQRIHFANAPLNGLLKLVLPGGARPTAEFEDPFVRPMVEPQESVSGWLYFQVERPVPLAELALALGGPQETTVTIPFSGPEPIIAVRSFEYLRSLDPLNDLIWSVSGGELRLDVPNQQANPGQEFIVVRIRATNVSTKEVKVGKVGSSPQDGKQYLRVRADNGVLLQVSAEINGLPDYFPPKAEQDSLYAWQLPKGSKNPKLVILSPDGSEHEIELGPLPPP